MESSKDVVLTPTPTAASSSVEPGAPRTRLIGTGNVHRGSRSYSIQSFGRRSSRDAVPLEKQPAIRRFQIDEQQILGSTGLLMPLYLSPLIYQGTPESLCLYSVLLPLCWWATGSIPRCVAALAPMVTLPVLQTMSADDAAAAFLTPASLELFIVLAITTAGYSSGSMIPRLSFTMCSKYGLQVVPLFMWLAAVTYVTSLFVPKAVVAVLLNLVVDKVLSCIHHCELDKTLIEQQDQREEPEKPHPQPVQTRQASVTSIETERLLAELAEVVVQLDHECADCKKTHKGSCRPPEPHREKWEIEEPPLPVPPTRRQPSLVSGNASRRQRSYGNSSTGSPGAFSPTSATEQRYSSLNLRLYQIKKEGRSAQDSQNASPAPRSGVPGCSTQSTPCAEVISNRSVSASPSPCKASTDQQKGPAACQKPASPSCLSSGATSAFEQSEVKKAVASQGAKDVPAHKNKEGAVKRTAADGGAEKGKRERDKGDAVSLTSKKKKKRSRHSKAPHNPNDPAPVPSPKRQRKRAHIGEKENVIEVPRDSLDSKATPVSPTATSPLVSAVASIASSVTPAFETTQSATPVPVGGEAAAVDMRRPSILKLPLRPKGWVPGLRYGAQGGSTALRKLSTVEFGLAHQVDILDDEQEQDREEEDRERPENLLRTRFYVDVPVKRLDDAVTGAQDSGGLTDKPAGTSPPTSPSSPTSSESRTGSRCKARRYSVAMCLASPSGVAMTDAELAQRRALASARRQFNSSATSFASVASTKEDKLATRLRLQMSQRTAFMLCCSLVTMTASLSSSLTMAAMDALTQHAVVKRGVTGLLTWLLLMMPTSLIATAFCCAALYLLHLRNRSTQTVEDRKDVCVAATTELNKLGPVKPSDLLVPYGLMCYALFVCFAPMIGYSSGKHTLSFLSVLLLAFSVMPVAWLCTCAPEHRMIVWSDMSRDMPWAVLFIHGTVQLATSIVQSNKLLPAGFALLGSEFWSRNSRLTNQAVIGAIGSLLAETINNDHLSADLVPLVLQIAQDNDVPGAAYAVPAAVGASCNMILPIHLPMIVAHEVTEVPMVQIFIIGTLAKTFTVVFSIVSVNAYGPYLIPWTDPTLNSTHDARSLASPES